MELTYLLCLQRTFENERPQNKRLTLFTITKSLQLCLLRLVLPAIATEVLNMYAFDKLDQPHLL